MEDIKFEWNAVKARKNLQKHGISFHNAKKVFWDEQARIIADPDSSIGEERFLILGNSLVKGVLVVCHCYRMQNDVVRIISARKATSKERKQYERYVYAR